MNHQECSVGELWNRIDERIEEYTSENIEATNRIIAIAEDARRVGVNTLTELDLQGQKLLNIYERGVEMEEKVKQSKTMLMQSFLTYSPHRICCGWFKSSKKSNAIRVINKKVISVQPTRLKSKTVTIPNSSCSSELLGQQHPDNEIKSQDKFDRNLRTISLILEDLSDISKDMRDELDCQNELIADTIKQSTSVTEELQSANRLTKYFL